MKNPAICFASGLILVTLSGCSPALCNLAQLGANRQETETYVKQQEVFFAKLDQDAKSDQLKVSTPLSEIIHTYGKPVLSRVREYKGQLYESLLYRHPLKFFSSDLIYLYFDRDWKLIAWQITPPA